MPVPQILTLFTFTERQRKVKNKEVFPPMVSG